MMFGRIVIFEIKRAFHEINFKLSILIGQMIVLLDLCTFYAKYKNSDSVILLQAWIGTDFQFAYNSLFYILLPLLACMPYAGSYFTDMQSGYEKNILLKIERKKYIVAKMIAVYCSASFCVVVPLLTNLFLLAGLFPDQLPNLLAFNTANIIDYNIFPALFYTRPVGYCLVFILLAGLFAGVFGMISVAISKWCRSSFSVIMFPFVLYIVTDTFFSYQQGNSVAIMEMLNPIQKYIVTYKGLIVNYLVLVIGSFGVAWGVGRKRNVL